VIASRLFVLKKKNKCELERGEGVEEMYEMERQRVVKRS